MRLHKLVRDKIPAILQQQGKSVKFRQVVSRDEKFSLLKKKLMEEVEEFLKDETREELVDILEVVEAICAHMQCPMEAVMALKAEKRQERGGFEQGIFLEEIDS